MCGQTSEQQGRVRKKEEHGHGSEMMKGMKQGKDDAKQVMLCAMRRAVTHIL